MSWRLTLSLIVTDNFLKSVGIAILAFIIGLMPFFWSFFDVVFDSATKTMSGTATLTLCLDEWLLGSIAVGVATTVNWLESRIDFELDPFSAVLTFFSGIGALLALIVYVKWNHKANEILQHMDHFAAYIEWFYYMGIVVLTTGLISICQCRRSKDMGIFVRRN